MQDLFFKLIGHASDLAGVDPLIALFLGAALLAVFLESVRRPKTIPIERPGFSGLLWTLYHSAARVLWAAALVLFLVSALNVLRTYLHQVGGAFEHDHGRITEANYSAVRSIWGAEQQQEELKVVISHQEQVTERIESEDLTKPAIIRQKTVTVAVVGNPYVSENHTVTLSQNPRKKGSAYYDGFETDCSFAWKLHNPADSPQNCTLTFPLPVAGAVYNGLTATLNGADVLPKMQIVDGGLMLDFTLDASEDLDFRIAFKSRGLAYWYFQIPESREIRDFNLTLNLPDLPASQLNYPAECMTPTAIKPTTDGHGLVLTYHLDHALSNKGMGIALPQLPQPGETTRAVLGEVERAWLLTFAALALGLTLAQVRQAVLLTILFVTASAMGYGLLADFSDLFLGFWGTILVVLFPLFLFLAWLLWRVGRNAGLMLAVEWVLCGLIYPCAAGMDPSRQNLYLDLYGLLLLAANTWLLLNRLAGPETNNALLPPSPTASLAGVP